MHLDDAACYRAVLARDARFDGRFFTAVRTTRTYCRPVCPARPPRPGNCIFFPSAAAAQAAGFRPCLRCRPETAPDRGAWCGTSNTVARALALIDAGALDAADVEALASRVGIGERQLRRLFRHHLGASPVAVAQTRRLLLATQLIHETDLTMTEVALAAGFGSVRRFNDAFRRLYARPPSTLRRQRQPSGHGAPDTAVSLRLTYRPPYDWTAMSGFLAVRAIPGVERVEAGRYLRTIECDGTHGTIVVEPDDRADALRVTVCGAQLAALPAIIARSQRVFDLAADPTAIGSHLAEDAWLARLVVGRPGLRVPGAWDGFELAVRAVLGQQITVAAATRLAGRLVAAYGKPLGAAAMHEGLTHVFPRPERLAEADLAALGMPRARAAALSQLAVAAAGNPGLFEPCRDLDDAVARLRVLPGVGEWTAQYIAMRALRESDAFPAADVGLQRATADEKGQRLSASALRARAERWRPWRAYAALHLWMADAQRLRRTGDEPCV